ncbi:hypothetical protein SAMN06265222_101777 [Neorhodopirellula lusitana]|uniref:Uncharacterized protein n=1 Tax=Neorhodopirellula lusitana TaxID=445327 RepID=A0ABY1PUS3_9BACT|nr:hypothetical protein [Neorhodopirellula lusitana]SMP42403.1 hypothetical protein SAMN06265222_101777 [Neorhodopirellula lusitana]
MVEPMIKAGMAVKIKKEYQDDGDEKIVFIAVDNEEKGRVTIQAQLGMTINPTQVVKVEWLEATDTGKCSDDQYAKRSMGD